MERIVVYASRRHMLAGRRFISRKALEADLPGLYLILVGTEADPTAIAEAITRRIRPSVTDGG